MSKVKDLHRKWSRDTTYPAAYDEQGPEFELARALTLEEVQHFTDRARRIAAILTLTETS